MSESRFKVTPAALSAAVRGDVHNALLAATPGGIEAQEAQGQRELCQSGQKLPKDMGRYSNPPITRELLTEKLGIKFGADADDIFVYAELPKGWKIVPTDHSMHNDLLDEKGRKRAGIFYKAAFYDRSAHINFSARYYVSAEYQDVRDDKNHNKRYRVVDSDGEKTLFATEWFDSHRYPNPEEEALGKLAKNWALEHFPNHEDVFAYWGTEHEQTVNS